MKFQEVLQQLGIFIITTAFLANAIVVVRICPYTDSFSYRMTDVVVSASWNNSKGEIVSETVLNHSTQLCFSVAINAPPRTVVTLTLNAIKTINDQPTTEFVSNYLPFNYSGWVQAFCDSLDWMVCRAGYSQIPDCITDSLGSHGGCSYCAMRYVTCVYNITRAISNRVFIIPDDYYSMIDAGDWSLATTPNYRVDTTFMGITNCSNQLEKTICEQWQTCYWNATAMNCISNFSYPLVSSSDLRSIAVIIDFDSVNTNLSELENEIAIILGIDVNEIDAILISSTQIQIIISGQSLEIIQQNANTLIEIINNGDCKN